MKYFIYIGIIFCLFLSTICIAESGIKLTELKTNTFEDLPIVDWVYNVDASNGYIGTISGEKKTFQLFSDEGKLLFVKYASDNQIYGNVRLSENSEHVLLGSYRSHSYYYNLYNYSGDQLINTIKSKNVIWTSPNCSYFFSRNGSGENNREPQVYNKDGNLLVTFNNVYSNWEINCISDSLLVYQNDNKIQLISVPDLSIQKEIIISDNFEHPSRVVTSISKDGSTYAFSSNWKIIVVDLNTGETSTILKDGTDFPINTEFQLSSDGQYLVTYRSSSLGQKIDVFQRDKLTYKKRGASYYLSDYGHWSCKQDAIILENSYCGITYFTNKEGCMLNKSFIFKLPDQNSDTIKGLLIDGFITIETTNGNKDSMVFRVNSVNKKETSLYKIQGEINEVE